MSTNNIKKYAKAVQILLTLPFEFIKPHWTLLLQDLYEFLEDDILQLCPTNVQRVSKVRDNGIVIMHTL